MSNPTGSTDKLETMNLLGGNLNLSKILMHVTHVLVTVVVTALYYHSNGSTDGVFWALLGAIIGSGISSILNVIILVFTRKKEGDIEEKKNKFFIDEMKTAVDSKLDHCIATVQKALDLCIERNRREANYHISFKSNNKIHERINEILGKNNVKKIQIICYGTNNYGATIDFINAKDKTFDSDVIFCSPTHNVFENDDKRKIYYNLEEMVNSDKFSIKISSIPPSIRASLITDNNGDYIWCSMNSYIINPTRDGKYTLEGDWLTPIISTEKDNGKMMKNLSCIFNEEFKRLEEHCKTLDKETLPVLLDKLNSM